MISRRELLTGIGLSETVCGTSALVPLAGLHALTCAAVRPNRPPPRTAL